MSSRRVLLLATAVFAGALVLRLGYLNAGLWHTDSVLQARAVEATVLRGEFTYMQRPGYPGQVALGAVFFWIQRLFTDADSAYLATTVQSAVAGALAAGLAVLVARRLDAGNVGIRAIGAVGAGVAVGVLPPLLSTTTIAKSHGSQAALLLGAALLALRGEQSSRVRAALLCGLTAGLAVAVRTDTVLVAPALLLLLWRGRALGGPDLRSRLMEGVAFAAALLAVPLVFYAKQFRNSGLTRFVEASSDTRFLGPLSAQLPGGLADAARCLTIPGALLAVVGLAVLWRRDRWVTAALIAWFGVSFAYVANTGIAVPRHLIVAILPLALASGFAVDAAARWRWYAGAAAVAALGLFMFLPLEGILRARARACPTAEFASGVGERTPPDALVLAQDLHIHLEYYARRETRFRAAFLESGAEFASLAEESLRILAGEVSAGRPVYVTSDAFTYDGPLPGGELLRVAPDGGGPGEEIVGAWGLALLDSFDLEHVWSAPYEDWHGASLGPRAGAARTQNLYRVVAR